MGDRIRNTEQHILKLFDSPHILHDKVRIHFFSISHHTPLAQAPRQIWLVLAKNTSKNGSSCSDLIMHDVLQGHLATVFP